MKKKKVIIIGCGIAGPTLALALNKAGINSEIYEAQKKPPNFGLLSLTSNGINILKMLDVYNSIKVDDSAKIFFYNYSGRNIFKMDFGGWMREKFGSGMIIIRRENLIREMTQKVISNGTTVEFGKRLVEIKETDDKVTVHFEDGTCAEGDFLIGCDGLRSKTRTIIIPDAPLPEYSGTVVIGSELGKTADHNLESNAFHMTLAKNTLCGASVEIDNNMVWWSYIPYPEESIKTELKDISYEQWTKKLLEFHKDDSQIKRFVKMSRDYVKIPIYSIPHLDKWYRGRVCLIGDAAHATSPHIGQGAAASMEDAVVLAKCLRDIPDFKQSFAKFESFRKDRVEKIVREAQKSGKIFLRSGILGKVVARIFLKFGLRESNFKKGQNWIFSYKIDWDEKIKI
ncbi:MAG: FAD-dependent oxidoreductase [Nitrosopumilus sp.]